MRVRYTKGQIWWGRNDDPRKHLVADREYEVIHIDGHSWHTKYTLAGLEGLSFNSVHFKEVATVASLARSRSSDRDLRRITMFMHFSETIKSLLGFLPPPSQSVRDVVREELNVAVERIVSHPFMQPDPVDPVVIEHPVEHPVFLPAVCASCAQNLQCPTCDNVQEVAPPPVAADQTLRCPWCLPAKKRYYQAGGQLWEGSDLQHGQIADAASRHFRDASGCASCRGRGWIRRSELDDFCLAMIRLATPVTIPPEIIAYQVERDRRAGQ